MLKKHNISSKSLIGKRLLMEAKASAFFVNHKLMNHFHEERSNEDEVIHGMIHSKHIEEMNSTQELNVQVEIPNSSIEENMSLDNFQENILTEADKELEILETSPLEEVHSKCVSSDYVFTEREYILWLSRAKRIKHTACKYYTQIIRVFHIILDPENYIRCAFESEACTTVARKYWSLYYFNEFLQIKTGKQMHILKELNYYKVSQ